MALATAILLSGVPREQFTADFERIIGPARLLLNIPDFAAITSEKTPSPFDNRILTIPDKSPSPTDSEVSTVSDHTPLPRHGGIPIIPVTVSSPTGSGSSIPEKVPSPVDGRISVTDKVDSSPDRITSEHVIPSPYILLQNITLPSDGLNLIVPENDVSLIDSLIPSIPSKVLSPTIRGISTTPQVVSSTTDGETSCPSSRTPSPAYKSEFTFDFKLQCSLEYKPECTSEYMSEYVPQIASSEPMYEFKSEYTLDYKTEATPDTMWEGTSDVPSDLMSENMSELKLECKSECSSETRPTSSAWGDDEQVLNSVIYYLDVIDRLEQKFIFYDTFIRPYGYIYSSLDPKVMYQERDILDLSSNIQMESTTWKFQHAVIESGVCSFFGNRSPLSRLDGAKMPRHTIITCKEEDCGYDEPVYL